MSKYTVPLRTYFDQYAGDATSTRGIIENGRSHLFDFEYPIFDEDYKKVFETNFIRKFYMREIGFETFGLFKFQLETWLLINMPYFNKLFESELLVYDPLTNAKMDVSHTTKKDRVRNDEITSNTTKTTNIDGDKTTTTVGDNESTTDQSTSSVTNSQSSDDKTTTDDDFNRSIESNTPDGRLNLTATDGEGVIEYASKITENNANNARTESATGTNDTSVNVSDSEKTSQNTNITTNEIDDTDVTDNTEKNDTITSTINNLEDYVQHRVGKIGVQSYGKLIKDYRDSLLRVERRIFDEMNELFMLVY